MRRALGFTLIELLVVIAIISILAGIILPNVSRYIGKARGTRAVAEINGIDLALTSMLADAGQNNFAAFFDEPRPAVLDIPTSALTLAQVKEAEVIYTDAFYILLKNGKNANLNNMMHSQATLVLNAAVRRKLSDQYMSDLGNDPWGNLYQFFAGPWYGGTNNEIPFVIHSIDSPIPGGPQQSTYTVQETQDPNVSVSDLAFEPAKNLPMYVYSMGANMRSNQPGDPGYDGNGDLGPDSVGGGDDINNWDKGASWSTFY